MLILTDKAAEKFKQFLVENNAAGNAIRIYSQSGG